MKVRYVPVLLLGCVTLNACARRGDDVRPLNATGESSTGPLGGVALAGEARISGKIIDESGHPLQQAIVRIQSLSRTLEASTDSDGRYEIAGIRSDIYTAMARKEGYVTLLFGQVRPFEPGAVIDLRNAIDNEHLDFTMDHGGQIVGRVTDESGHPLADAIVSAIRGRGATRYRPRWRIAEKSLEARAPEYDVGHTPTKTDARGLFRLSSLPPASYFVSVVVPQVPGNDSSIGYPRTYFPGTANFDSALPVEVATGHVSVASLAALPERLSAVSGRVVNSSGHPIAATTVRVLSKWTRGIVEGGGAVSIVQTGADGSFTARSVPAGEFVVTALSGSPWRKRDVQNDVELGVVPITVTRGAAVQAIQIVTRPGAVVFGVLNVSHDLRHSVPEHGFRVFAISLDRPELEVLGSARVDEYGNFELHNVFGRAVLSTDAVRHGTWLREESLRGADVTMNGFDADRGGRLGPVRVTVTNQSNRVTGVVRKGSNSVGAGGVVLIVPVDEHLWHDPLKRFTKMVRAAPDGRYEIRGLASGYYALHAAGSLSIDALEDDDAWKRCLQVGSRINLGGDSDAHVDLECRSCI
jgi:carboxypeptidase family protein